MLSETERKIEDEGTSGTYSSIEKTKFDFIHLLLNFLLMISISLIL